jgi:hypothetical protein
MKREVFHTQVKGAYAEDDDDYTLITDEIGNQSVEHKWSYVDVYKTGKLDKGEKTVSVKEFLDGPTPENIKAKLRALLGGKHA